MTTLSNQLRALKAAEKAADARFDAACQVSVEFTRARFDNTRAVDWTQYPAHCIEWNAALAARDAADDALWAFRSRLRCQSRNGPREIMPASPKRLRQYRCGDGFGPVPRPACGGGA